MRLSLLDISLITGKLFRAGPRCQFTSFRGNDNLVMPTLAQPARQLQQLALPAAQAAQPSADARGIHLSVETELEPDTAVVDRQQWYRALAGLLTHLLETWPTRQKPDAGTAGTLALRLGPDVPRGGFQVELICIGIAIPREQVIARGRTAPAAFARQVAAAHGGALYLLPPDSPDMLARLRMPSGPPEEQKTTIRRKD